MIKNTKAFQKFEKNYINNSKVNVISNFHMVDALYREAVTLGIFPLKNPLDGLEIDIKIAKVVNNVPKAAGKNNKSIG